MRHFLVAVTALAACSAFAVRAEPTSRTLSDREMWVTFGGVNDKQCEYNDSCDGDSNNCSDMDGEGQAACETHEHEVAITLPNMDHCVEAEGWNCTEGAQNYSCLRVFRCEYVNGDCRQIPAHLGGEILEQEVEVPSSCSDTEPPDGCD
jgi:hypothetical protein